MTINVTKFKENGDDLTELESRSFEASPIDFFFGELRPVWFGLVPPLSVLNYFLAHGSYGAADQQQRGIHYIYKWIPFQVTAEEHGQIVEGLRQLPDRRFEEVEPPIDVCTVPEYEHWSFVRWMERQHGDCQRQHTDP